MKKSPTLPTQIAIALTLVAFAMRLLYALNSNPFIDEFTTVLASRMILSQGFPILPSGLFYEHGMLFSYLAAPIVALAAENNLLLIARLPSLLISTATIPVIYHLGRRWFSPWVGVAAAAMMAFSPEGMVWGGRARMYALAQLLLLLAVAYGYEGGKSGGKSKLRWLGIILLLAALLNHFGVIIFIPTMLAGIVFLRLQACGFKIKPSDFKFQQHRIWLAQLIGVLVVTGIGILVKRLGQPLGMTQLGSDTASNPIIELWQTIAYQINLLPNAENATEFLARQFGTPHHLWLAVAATLGLLVFGLLHAFGKHAIIKPVPTPPYTFLWIVFGLVVVEMITVLASGRQNPRYLVMGLPLFYLLAAAGLDVVTRYAAIFTRYAAIPVIAVFFVLHGRGLWLDLNIAYKTPEPAYDDAFQYVAQHQDSGDPVLTMNTSAAALYLEKVDYFAMQEDAEQFLLHTQSGAVDRWLGIPHVGAVSQFNQILNENANTWFVVDQQRLTSFGFYRGDWIALLNTQMEQAWEKDGALVFHTRADRLPVPTKPDQLVAADFGQQIKLNGHALSASQLTFFWEGQSTVDADYSVFIHLRDANNSNVAQWDRQPLDGAYPTSRWKTGEQIADPIPFSLPDDLPPGTYRLLVGLYRLDTLERLPLVNDTSGENAVVLRTISVP